jgi:hypothetical protein
VSRRIPLRTDPPARCRCGKVIDFTYPRYPCSVEGCEVVGCENCIWEWDEEPVCKKHYFEESNKRAQENS